MNSVAIDLTNDSSEEGIFSRFSELQPSWKPVTHAIIWGVRRCLAIIWLQIKDKLRLDYTLRNQNQHLRGRSMYLHWINLKKYSGTPLYGHLLNTNTRIIKTQFHLYVAHIFFLKFALNTSTSWYNEKWTLFCIPTHKLPYIINPALRTLFICALSTNEYHTCSESLNKNRKWWISKVLSHI